MTTVIRFLSLCLLVLIGAIEAGAQHISPKTDSLLEQVTDLTYNSQFDEAQQLVLDFLEKPGLLEVEVFYGHFLFADIVKSLGNSSKAIKLLKKSQEYLKNVENKALFESLIYGNLGECYFNILDFDRAKKYALQSIAASPHKSLRGSGHAVNNLIIGFSYYKEEKDPIALEYYHAAIQEYLRHDEFCELPLCYIKIAEVHLRQEDYNLAKNILDKAIALSDSCDIDHYRILSSQYLLKYYRVKKEYENAFRLLENINALHKRVNQKKRIKEIQDLEVKYETKLTQSENENLKENVRIQNLNNQFKTTLLIASLVGVFTILLLVIYTLRMRNKKNEALSIQLAKIEAQNAERETLLKEVHHRVKNNLQVITSLLSLQASQIRDQNTIELFHQSQYRVNAMAMVHEMLYQSDNLSKIKIQTYLEELVTSLIVSIKGKENNIKVDLEMPPVYLGLDTAIPLGLLINEVLTNALTHGIEGDEVGEVYVELTALEAPKFLLKIGDSGVGYPAEVSFQNSDSLGLKLMHKLSRQLLGSIKRDMTQAGCHYIVDFQEVEA